MSKKDNKSTKKNKKQKEVNKDAKKDMTIEIGEKIYSTTDKLLENEKPQLILTSVLSFVSVLTIMVQMWPITEPIMLFYSLLFIVFALFVSIFVARDAFLAFLLVINKVTEPFAITSKQEKKAKERIIKGNKKVKDLGVGPKAEVTIKYFLEMEKTNTIYNAKYIGKI